MLQSSSYATKLFKIDIRNTGGMSMHLATQPFILIMFAALVYLYPLQLLKDLSPAENFVPTTQPTFGIIGQLMI